MAKQIKGVWVVCYYETNPNPDFLPLDLFYMRTKINFYFGFKNIILSFFSFLRLFKKELNWVYNKIERKMERFSIYPVFTYAQPPPLSKSCTRMVLFLFFLLRINYIDILNYFYMQPNPILIDKAKTTCQN